MVSEGTSGTRAGGQSEETSQVARNNIQSMLVELLARDETQEILEKHCASDEIIALMEQREGPSKLGPENVLGIPPGVRRVTAWHMAYLMTNLKLPDNAWFHAVTLMDDYSQRVVGQVTGVSISLAQMPALGVAMARIIRKINDAYALAFHDEYVFKEFRQHLAKWLETLGYDIEGWENISTNIQEEHILMTAQLSLPTVESWLLVLCTRLNVVAQRVLMQSVNIQWQKIMDKLCQQGVGFARLILLNRATQGEFRPRRVAQGLLAIGMIISKLLPVQAMGFEVGSPEWEWFEAQSDKGEQTMLDAHQHDFVLELVQATTVADIDELVQDCSITLQVLSDLVVPVSHGSPQTSCMAEATRGMQQSEQVLCGASVR